MAIRGIRKGLDVMIPEKIVDNKATNEKCFTKH